MMYGYGLDRLCADGAGVFGSGWMVTGMMGLGFLLIVGVIVWALVSQRDRVQHAFVAPPATYGQAPAPAPRADTAEAIARERFARGEIDREEYDRLMATLRAR